MKTPKPPSPKPMPITSMPDRASPGQGSDYGMKAGLRTTGLVVNPGKPADDEK